MRMYLVCMPIQSRSAWCYHSILHFHIIIAWYIIIDFAMQMRLWACHFSATPTQKTLVHSIEPSSPSSGFLLARLGLTLYRLSGPTALRTQRSLSILRGHRGISCTWFRRAKAAILSCRLTGFSTFLWYRKTSACTYYYQRPKKGALAIEYDFDSLQCTTLRS